MATKDTTPVNLDILSVGQNDIRKLGKISTPQIFDNNNNFHPEGLFSTTTFGAVGSQHRSTMYGYIDLNCKLLHPLIYVTLTSLKSLYKDVAEGKKTAIYDPKEKDLVQSDDVKADTGYTFLMSVLPKLKFKKTESDKRDFSIALVEKAIKENNQYIEYMLVMPAGLRDYFVDQSGKPQEDEINSYYRKIVNQSNIIDPAIAKKTPESYDNLFVGLQNSLVDLYEYIISLLDGKHKLVLGKWLSRKVFNSTRNVLSGYVERGVSLDDPNRLGYNDCKVGIHQYYRVLVPKSIYELRNKYLQDIFIDSNNIAYLTNVKTLKREQVNGIDIQKDYERWTTGDGLDKVIASLENIDIRHEPIILNKGKHYIGLVYNDGKYFKFLQDIDDVPEGFDKEKVKPITLVEFLYMSIYETNGKIPGLVTRYPIQGFGGIYPAYVKLQTTIEFDVMEELDYQWKPSGKVATTFPKRGIDFYNTITVHPSHLGKLGGDFDGDTVSLTGMLLDDVGSEIEDVLSKRSYYISDSNQIQFNIDNEPLNAVLKYMN